MPKDVADALKKQGTERRLRQAECFGRTAANARSVEAAEADIMVLVAALALIQSTCRSRVRAKATLP
jgi:hypothetical protein